MRRAAGLRVAVTAVLLLPFAGGCATHSGGFASHFVKPGKPSVSLDDPNAAAPASGLQEFARKVRALQSRAQPKSTMLPSIETQNPAIQKGILLVALHETAAAHRELAYAYKTAGVTDFALKHFQRAIALEPCDAAAYDGMARVWRDAGLPGLGLGDAYRAINCQPASAEIYNTLGTLFLSLGQEGNARGAFLHALALQPQAAYALNNMCYMEVVGDHLSDAERLCRAAVAQDPTLDAARNNLAALHIRRGDPAAAMDDLSNTDSANAEYNLGVLKFASGTFAEAAEAFDDAASHPGMRMARSAANQARAAAKAAEKSHDQR
jgi:Flp pilus assembly protein TadD